MYRRCLALLAAGLLMTACSSPRPSEQAGTSGGTGATLATCTGCHGNAANGNAAPPVSVQGATATSDVRVGAHQAHLHDSAIRQAVPCSECHVVPANVNDPGHIDKPTADVVWGPLASTGGKSADYARSPDGTTATCAVYCHGAAFTSDNGALHQPSWTVLDGTQAGCGTCHGVPPPAPHPQVGPSFANCAACHPDTVRPDGTIDVAGGKHINGVVDLAGGGSGTCTSCHGDASRGSTLAAAAPPRDTKGNTATTDPGVGAHQRHLTGGAIRGAMQCSDCHPVPTDFAHATQPLQLAFSALARSEGVAASFDATALTCTTYCHGASLTGGSLTKPVWTQGSSQAACGTCHGLPPTSGQHQVPEHAAVGCAACHGQGYSATTVNLATHVDGARNVGGTGSVITTWTKPSCTPLCHATRSW